MKFKTKKYVLTPLTISLIMLTLSPIIAIDNNPKNQNKNNSNEPSSSSSDNSIINTILDSFGLENRVFADCNSYPNYCTVTAPNICVPEGNSGSGNIYGYEGGYNNTYPVEVDIQNLSGITVSPLTGSFNNYPSGTPTDQSITLNYNVTGPPVSITDDPGDASGPYSGLGRKKFSANAHVIFQDWNGSAWTGGSSPIDQAFTITVDHANNAPTVNTISSDYSATVANSSVLTDIPVSFSFSDVESNHMDVVLELSNDNFSTILQTQTFSNTSAGTVLNYTFTSLAVGSYQWRVTATETDAVGTCAGFSNVLAGDNLQVSATKNISLTVAETSSTSSSGSSTPASPPVCSNQKPGAPSGLTAVSGPKQGQETLSWIAPQGPVTDYSISYSDDPSIKRWGVVSTGNVTNYVISGLGNGKHYFWVNAVNGCMPGDTVSPSTPVLPITGPSDIIRIGIIGIIFVAIGLVTLIFI